MFLRSKNCSYRENNIYKISNLGKIPQISFPFRALIILFWFMQTKKSNQRAA